MGIFQNSGFNGFIGSVRKTMQGYTEHFLSGFAGYGWKLWKTINGRYKFEIDDLVVRGSMTIFELIISKIRAIKGALNISQGSERIEEVEEYATEYRLTIEADTNSIMEDDFLRCERFDQTKKRYHVIVSRVEGRFIFIDKTEFEGSGIPEIGDDIVQFGNKTNKARQSCIYLHADENGTPAIDVMFEVDSKDWSNKTKIRLGGDIPGGDGAKGLFCENGMLLCNSAQGDIIYRLSPDGSINLGKGALVYDPKTNKMTLGNNVTIEWENLNDETKENIKGKDGVNGKWMRSIYQFSDTKPQRPVSSNNWLDTPDQPKISDIKYQHLITCLLSTPNTDLYNPWVLSDNWFVSPANMPNSCKAKAKITFTTSSAYQTVELQYNLSCETADSLMWGNVDSGLFDQDVYGRATSSSNGVETRGSIYFTIPIPGVHFVEIQYLKDGSVQAGRDNVKIKMNHSNLCWMSQSQCSYVNNTWVPSTWSEPKLFLADSADQESIYWLSHVEITPLPPISQPQCDDFIPNLLLDKEYSTRWVPGVAIAKDQIFQFNDEYYQALEEILKDYTYFSQFKTRKLNQWTDNPSGVSTDQSYEFISIRKKSNGVWGDFSNPTLWVKYSSDSNLLDWIEDWNGTKTQIGGEFVISPKMFSGTNVNDKLTGVAFGRDVIEINGVKQTGVFGIKDNIVTFKINALTGDVEANHATLNNCTANNLTVNYGTFKNIKAESGHIGEAILNSRGLYFDNDNYKTDIGSGTLQPSTGIDIPLYIQRKRYKKIPNLGNTDLDNLAFICDGDISLGGRLIMRNNNEGFAAAPSLGKLYTGVLQRIDSSTLQISSNMPNGLVYTTFTDNRNTVTLHFPRCYDGRIPFFQFTAITKGSWFRQEIKIRNWGQDFVEVVMSDIGNGNFINPDNDNYRGFFFTIHTDY